MSALYMLVIITGHLGHASTVLGPTFTDEHRCNEVAAAIEHKARTRGQPNVMAFCVRNQ